MRSRRAENDEAALRAERWGGLDVGSVSVKLVVLDADGAPLVQRYERHKGEPEAVALRLLADALNAHGGFALTMTGSGARRLADEAKAEHISELAAHAAGVLAAVPDTATIIEIGGEDSKLITLADGVLDDFSLNSVCAAGTGAFLDQQAERMGLSIQDFSAVALECPEPPRVAGRCSVFAKSDMIHLQQVGASVPDIVAGLCFAVARNFKGAIVRGRAVRQPVAFVGGVALSAGMRRALREVLGLDALHVPPQPTTTGAHGAALIGQREGRGAWLDTAVLAALRQRCEARRTGRDKRAPLVDDAAAFAARHPECMTSDVAPLPPEGCDGYLGVDVGSISTNLAVVDAAGRVLARRYLRTASRPIEAVRRGLREIGHELGGRVRICGVGTTGSGRYMIADFIGADVVLNEITAQARAAVFLDPAVDTIFEIGGQDSKFISIDDGVIADFAMNKACAAGTGSFLEEQAEKLGIDITGEFAQRALGAEAPCRLGERCTVFMENSLLSALAQGADMDDLLAGLAYSIVENYLGRVVGKGRIGSRIFFQGGTAFNRAVIAAFERILETPIVIPQHHDVTGAIGMALSARDAIAEGERPSAFRGFHLGKRRYEQKSFTCKGCENHCEIRAVRIEGEADSLYYGGRCEKYDIRRSSEPPGEDLFAFRHSALMAEHARREGHFREAGERARRGRMGVPQAFFLHDMLPFVTTLLWECGFEPVLSPTTRAAVTRLGAEAVLADTCFPVKAALGHALHLLHSQFDAGEGCEALFVPSFINMNTPDDPHGDGLSCPLTQSYPFQVRQLAPRAAVVAPALNLRRGDRAVERELHAALRPWRVTRREVRTALSRAWTAQRKFEDRLRAKGREVLEHLDTEAAVVVGRPYNAFDSGMNLDLPRKLAGLGIPAIPMDFLPAEDVSDTWGTMYWRSGQRILRALRAVRGDARLYPVCIGSFSCGPDAFINTLAERELAGTPALFLEIDEHSADAGIITRVEAFWDSIGARRKAGREQRATRPRLPRAAAYTGRGRTVYLPRMSDGAYGLESAFRACGVEAEVLPRTTPGAVSLAQRECSGKECYPYATTLGDVLAKCAEPGFQPQHSAFFMPGGTGPCRFGQYNHAQSMVLDSLGYADVPLYAPEQSARLYDDMGIAGRDLARRCWYGIVAYDLLTKCLHETRPNAAEPEQVDACHREHCRRLRQALRGPLDAAPRALAAARDDFAALHSGHSPQVPRIGIVGEIYVRSNAFCNEDICRKVMDLGGEPWLAPIGEWIAYVNAMSVQDACRQRDLRALLTLGMTRRVQGGIQRRLEHVFDGHLRTIHEPNTAATLRAAAPYISDSLRGEAVLSVGAAVNMIHAGCHGFINVMPFGCMPGTVVTALLRTVSHHYGVPCITLAFDGTESPANRLHVEAFMEQAKARAQRQAETRSPVPAT
jgi:predicted CoA-substrate-specific enzyme activase